MSFPLTRTPTTPEIQHRFAEILSAGPLRLEDIADKLDPFGRGHEDAFVAVFSEIVERIEEDGIERFQILPEYAIQISKEESHNKDKTRRETTSLPAFPSDTIQRHDSASVSSTLSLSPPPLSPPPQKIEHELSSPSSSSLSSPPPSSTLSSPPATPDLRTPSPEPALTAPPTKRKNAPSPPSSPTKASPTSSVTKDDSSPKKKRKRVTKKTENTQRVQCSGITRHKKTQCRFQKMMAVGQTSWDCGRHGRSREKKGGDAEEKRDEQDE